MCINPNNPAAAPMLALFRILTSAPLKLPHAASLSSETFLFNELVEDGAVAEMEGTERPERQARIRWRRDSWS
jgi:hypothetical protein